MLEITTNFNLSEKNTFGLTAFARYFVNVTEVTQLEELMKMPLYTENSKMVLGGGSNILFTKDFPGLVIHPAFEGVEILEENADHVIVRVGSGMVWDDMVQYAVDQNWGGLENLTDIPGNVGASPVQNIGAYGVEVKDVLVAVNTVDLETGQKKLVTCDDCQLTYRNSIFKKKYRNKLLITHVSFRLKKCPHQLITHYGTVEEMLSHSPERTIRQVRQIIRDIRAAKLPDYKVTGNAGSFFKNPLVNLDIANKIQKEYPLVPLYSAEENQVKLSAAWLIEQSGCKGIRKGNTATHDKQPLVLINLGHASGKEVLELARYVQQKVKDKFGVELEPEVNII